MTRRQRRKRLRMFGVAARMSARLESVMRRVNVDIYDIAVEPLTRTFVVWVACQTCFGVRISGKSPRALAQQAVCLVAEQEVE